MFHIVEAISRTKCMKPIFRIVAVISLVWLIFAYSPFSSTRDVRAQAGYEALYELVVELPNLPASVTVGQPSSSLAVSPLTKTARFMGEDIQYLTWTGEPKIPYRIIRVLLPPDAIVSTVSVDTQNMQFEEILGEWDVDPMPPMATWDGEKVITVWPQDKTIIDGRDIDIYQTDAFFPSSLLGAVNTGQMRKWALVEVPIALYQYNPATKKLLATSGGDLVVRFNRDPSLLTKSGTDALLADRISEDVVKQLTINFAEVVPEYEQHLQAAPYGAQASGYAILTTNQIRFGSSQLENFIRSKERRGFKVYVVTEETWGGGRGDVASENIRNWLKANYANLGIEYVLLIGNPHPTEGDVPMKMLWPNSDYSIYRESPSDYYYADLTGNWDYDDDGLFGEVDDLGYGGIDRNWEVLVGRIPFYGNLSDVDHILTKITAYESEPRDLARWRRQIMLAMMRLDSVTPGYDLGEAIKHNVIEAKGWSYHRAYEENFALIPPPETICDPGPYCDKNENKITNIWNGSQFGAVFWSTHGWERGATLVMDTSHAATLNDNYPSFTFQASCMNSWPEDDQNLSYTLLKNGAIASIGATRVSWYAVGEVVYNNSSTAQGMTYEFAERLVTTEMDSGHALYDLKQVLYPGAGTWMNFTVFNLYGDPAAGLFTYFEPVPHLTVTSNADNGPGTLRWAIAAIAPGGTIDFAVAQPTTITLTSGPLLIDKDMTIEGPGGGLLTISGNKSHRVFEVLKDVNATIKLLSITNGRAYGLEEPIGGGAIRNFGSLILDNAILTGNQALYGGAIRNQGTLKITNSMLATNKTVDIGARAAGDGGAIYNEGKLTVLDTAIGHNQAQGGGGILNWGIGTVELTNVSIDYNLATLSGGGLENGDHGSMTISNSSIIYNEAHGEAPLHGGGGIHNFGGTVTINNNSEISNNTALRGGGLYNSDKLNMTSCTLNANEANLFEGGGKGGGIYNIGDTMISECLITGNSANGGGGGARGGGIYTDGTLTLIDSTVSNNSAGSRVDYAGGGIYNGSGQLTVTGSTINDNRLTGNYLGDGGGGLYNGSGIANLTNCTIGGNRVSAGDPAGGIYSEGTLTLTNCTVTYNSGLQSGGIDGKATLINTIVANNTAHSDSSNCGSNAIISSIGHNLASDDTCDLRRDLDDLLNTDPLIGPLQDNGGSALTYALLPGSPAIDVGDDANCPNTDQRGVSRSHGAHCDIGAYELVQSTATAADSEIVNTSISPGVVGESGASITLTNNTDGSGSVEITVATYAQNPMNVPVLDVGGGFVDLQVNGADPSDVLVAKLYYPPTVTGTVEDQLSLLYFDGTKWTSVKSSGDIPPEKDTTSNLDETISGGRFLVTYDDTSIPKITELSGTAFTFVVNVPPQVEIGADELVNEGDVFFRTGTLRDPDSHTWTGTVDYGDSSEIEALAFKPDGTFDLSHTYMDNGSFTVVVTVTDEYGGIGTGTFTVAVNNVAPTIVEGIHITGVPVLIKTYVAASAVFTDPGSLDKHTATWDWGDGTSNLATADGFNITASHAYTAPGLYTMTLSVSDDDGGSDTKTYQYVVVYDPNAGFITGGKWIDSPTGSYIPDPTLTGKATFNFNVKYKKGAVSPEGKADFQFKAADLDFKSTSYDWLVIAGTKAQFQGSGMINGAGDYGFMITAMDGSPDTIRIKVWDNATGEVIYDTMPDAMDTVDPTTVVQKGSIVIHNRK